MMNNEILRKNVYKMVCEFLDDTLDNKKEDSQYIAITDVLDCNETLIIEAYCALFHRDEIGCSITKDEIQYYRDCFENKKIFSIEERNSILNVLNNPTKKE